MGRRMQRRNTLGVAAAAIGLLAGGVTAAAAIIAVRFARQVVTPPTSRVEDIRIAAVDLAAGEVVLAASAESRMRGRYGFWFEHESGHARLGDVVADGPKVVRRRIESVDFGRFDRATRGRMDGWYHLGPWELGHPYENAIVETPLGPAPAWFVPAESGSDRWIIQVHGRGAKRPEGLRAVEPAHEAGWNTLLISYRNDGEA
ncbi:MAG: alpha/beta hydrolase, partial [Actinomycetota bacterium]|nr:alpha/beta hydrolase [Actinomycetota bacterium]